MPELAQWNNFYVIVGSSAGALIGLQFVVVALIADTSRARVAAEASAAFSTPSVVHFAVVLLIAATNVAPWQGAGGIMVSWGIVGFGGTLYTLSIFARMRKQTTYEPVFEDWLFHSILPALAYALLFTAAIVVNAAARTALFMAGAVALILLFVGIHNAWDTATYHVLARRSDRKDKKSK